MKNKFLLQLSLMVLFMFAATVANSQCTTPTISGLSPTYCVNSPGSILTASPSGGIFQGAGVVGTTFSPSLAGPGTASVVYGTCTSSYALISNTTTSSGLVYSVVPTGASETGVTLGDDQTTGGLPIGFQFRFFCTTYTTFIISSNGFISFNLSAGNGCCSGQSLPNSSTSLDNMIAAHWADLNPGNGGSISYATMGTIPNRTLFVNYVNVPFFSGGGTVNSQIRLMETSNIIEIHTGTISTNSYAMTQGIENAGGTIATPVPGRNAATWTASGDAKRFTPLLNCISTATTFVSPTSVSVTGSSSICAGGSTTLTANGNTSYTWTGGTTSSNASVAVSPATTTSYSVSATNSFGCISSAAVNVTVFPGVPTLAINSNTTSTCLGKTVTLTATGAVTYTWNNGVTNGTSFSPSVTSNYIVTGANGCGSSTAAIVVSVVPYAVSAIVSPSVICAGNSATFNAVSAANLYTWMPSGATTASVVLGSSTSQIFTVTASDGTCVGTATVNLIANPVPTIVASPSLVTSLCAGNTVTLTATGGTGYTWTPGNITGAVITVTPNAPTAYQVMGSNSLGCTALANVAVITQQSPTVIISANNNLICSGDPVIITVTGANTYTWNNGSNTTTIAVNPGVTTTYSVTGEINTCTSSTAVTIAVFVPTLSVTGNTSICSGKTATIVASGANTYAWSNGQTSPGIQVTPSATTIYTVSALSTSAGINCPSSGSIQVSVKPNPTLTATPSRTAMCKNETNTITVAGASTYSWSTGVTTTSITINPTLVTVYNYSIIGTSSVNCSSTVNVSVKVNACTGIDNISKSNDLFLSVYPNPNNGSFEIKFEKDLKIKIVNELGQLMKTIQPKDSNNNIESISNLAAGIYFVIGERNDEVFTQKIIVQ